MRWTRDKLELIKVYLTQGYSYGEIAKILKLSYHQIEHAVRRYSLKEGLTDTSLFNKPTSKLKREDIDKLAKIIGEKLYENFHKVKLAEPIAIKSTGKKEEMSVLDLSDIHIGMINEVFDSSTGKKIVTYNMEIFKKELENLQQSIFDINSILRNSYNMEENQAN